MSKSQRCLQNSPGYTGSVKKGESKYEYIWVDKKGQIYGYLRIQIRIQIFCTHCQEAGFLEGENTNTDIANIRRSFVGSTPFLMKLHPQTKTIHLQSTHLHCLNLKPFLGFQNSFSYGINSNSDFLIVALLSQEAWFWQRGPGSTVWRAALGLLVNGRLLYQYYHY